MVVLTLLAMSVGLVAMLTEPSWLTDFALLWGRSCACLRMLVN
jgi:hypothetical protein